MLAALRGDVRALAALNVTERFDLALAVGVVPHLDGPEDVLRLLGGVRSLLAAGGRAVAEVAASPSLFVTLALPFKIRYCVVSLLYRSVS